MLLNQNKKREGLEVGAVTDYEAGTYFFQRRVARTARKKKRKAPEGVEEEKVVEAAAVSTGMFHNDSRSSTSIRDIDRSMQGDDRPFNRTASASASSSKKQRQRR